MEEIVKPDKTKDLLEVIVETNLIGMELNDHLKVLNENADDLKNDVYSKRIESTHLKILLKIIRLNIDKLLR